MKALAGQRQEDALHRDQAGRHLPCWEGGWFSILGTRPRALYPGHLVALGQPQGPGCGAGEDSSWVQQWLGFTLCPFLQVTQPSRKLVPLGPTVLSGKRECGERGRKRPT